MPVTKQAAKKLRRDQRRTKDHERTRSHLKAVVRLMRKSPTVKHLTGAYKELDKAAKTRLIHPNKASRLKSRLSRLLKKS